MNLNFLRVLAILILFLALSGCNTGQGAATAGSPTSLPQTPEMDKNTGALSAKIMDQSSGRPVAFEGFHLAELLPFEGEFEGAAVPALDPLNSPKDESDVNGQVVISKIIPNRYAFVLMTPHGPVMLEDVDTGEEIILEIKAGEVTDLGIITIQAPSELMETDQS